MNPDRLHDDSARNPDDYARGRPLARPIPTVPDPSDPSPSTTARGTSVVSVPGARTEVIPAVRTRYRAYLLSPEWRARRNRSLRLANYRCIRCGSKRGLEVHHKTYERLGHEWDDDLETLCHGCHTGTHVQAMHEAPERVYLKLVGELVLVQTFASISELSDALKDACRGHRVNYVAAHADRAMGLIAGRQAFSRPLPATHDDAIAEGKPLTAREAREILGRVALRLPELGAGPKTISPAISAIDIFGAIPRESWGDHDRY